MIFHMPHNIHFQYDIHRMWQKSPIRPSMTTESGATMHEANDPWQSLQASGPGKGLPQDCLIFSMCILYIYIYGWRIVFGFLLIRFGVFFWFLSWYHVPCICNRLELEPVILHGIGYMVACSPSILHGICYMFGTSTSRFAWYLLHVGTSNVHVGFFRVSFWVSIGFHLGCL